MTLTTVALKPCHPFHSPSFNCLLKSFTLIETTQKLVPSNVFSRRITTIAAANTILLAKDTMFKIDVASAFDFRITVPDQTAEEAESVIKEHAEDLLEVRPLFESGLWRDAQKALRKSSSLLKQDIYTLIQAKPGSERPRLRLLYSQLFNNVTSLDYAARSKDVVRCKEIFNNVVVSLDAILSKL